MHTRSSPALPLPDRLRDSLRVRAAALRPIDRAVAAMVLAYLLLGAVGASRWEQALALSTVLYLSLGFATIVQSALAARAAQPGRERLGWTLLTLAVSARLSGGFIWGLLGLAPGTEPPWLTALQLSYLAFTVPGLLVFPSSTWRGRDQLRARIDVATVLIGSLLVSWFLALGPLLGSPDLATAPLDDRLYAFGDSITVVLAAVLHLRSTSPAVRAAAQWLLLAFLLRLLPDLLIWRGGDPADFSAFAFIDQVWYLVWALLWLAARTAVRTPRTEPSKPARRERYRSGIVPLLFLVAALVVLLRTLVLGRTGEAAFYALGSAALTLLLLARQGVEFAERDRLTQRLDWERDRFAALLHHAYDAVALIGLNGTLRYASPSTFRLFGDQLPALGGEGLLELVHPDDRENLLAAFGEGGAPTRAIRLRARDRDGRWRTFEGHLSDHRADPMINGVVLHGIDRTRERRLNEGLQDTQPLEALGVLAGGLAHDLNNILTVVASHAELLENDSALDARARGDVAGISAASERARSLTRGLLTLSRRKDVGAAVLDLAAVARDRHRDGDPVEEAPGIIAQVRATPEALLQVTDALLEVGRDEARGRAVNVRVEERVLDEATAGPWRLEARRYVVLSVGTGRAADPPEVVEEAVRTVAGDEWDLAPGDLALLIALAACREIGGTVLRERRGEDSRLVALIPAVHQ